MDRLDFETVYKFKGIENLHCDLKGNFFYNEKPIKKVYNNGSAYCISRQIKIWFN